MKKQGRMDSKERRKGEMNVCICGWRVEVERLKQVVEVEDEVDGIREREKKGEKKKRRD